MITIPECLAHLPRWGEYPIPFTVPEAAPGAKPDFRAVSPTKHNLCVRFQMCGACGKHIPKPPYWLHIGPMCVREATVFAQPFHYDCAVAALRLCPWLSLRQRARHEARDGQIAAMTDLTLDELPDKPQRIGLGAVERYTTFANPHASVETLYIRLPPAGTYPLQWWSYQHGVLQEEQTT